VVPAAPSGGAWMAAFPHPRGAGWLQAKHATCLMPLAGPGLLRRARRLQQGHKQLLGSGLDGESGLGGHESLPGGSWRLAGRCRDGHSNRRQHPQLRSTTCPFRSLDGKRATGAGRLTAQPRPPQRQAGRGSGQLSDSTARPARPPGVQPRPDDLGRPTVCTPRNPPATLPTGGALRCYAGRRSRCLPVKEPTRPLPFPGDWRGRGGWHAGGRVADRSTPR